MRRAARIIVPRAAQHNSRNLIVCPNRTVGAADISRNEQEYWRFAFGCFLLCLTSDYLNPQTQGFWSDALFATAVNLKVKWQRKVILDSPHFFCSGKQYRDETNNLFKKVDALRDKMFLHLQLQVYNSNMSWFILTNALKVSLGTPGKPFFSIYALSFITVFASLKITSVVSQSPIFPENKKSLLEKIWALTAANPLSPGRQAATDALVISQNMFDLYFNRPK